MDRQEVVSAVPVALLGVASRSCKNVHGCSCRVQAAMPTVRTKVGLYEVCLLL